MQSGRGNIDEWVLEYESAAIRKPEPLMGWTYAGDTLGQVKLKFPTLDDAKNYAQKNGLLYTVLPSQDRKVQPRNYGDNFRYRAEDEQ